MASSLQLELFERPRFREGVELEFDDDGAECAYRDQGCRVEFGGAAPARKFLELLIEGGRTREELEEVSGFTDGAHEVLASLDTLGLLTETRLPAPTDVISGRQLYRNLRRMADALYDDEIGEHFYRTLIEGRATREQLVGYALEYYHLVRQAPRILAPALAKEEPGEISGVLQDFLAEELHHDRMLENSLSAVGITREQLRRTQPLASTFSLIASLGAYASQNPTTFKAALYLFEEPSPQFNEAFAQACARAGLPDAFVRPILAHARLNDDGDHGDISGRLLGMVPVVGAEEQHTVAKHLAILVETLALQDREIASYYGSPDAVVPRIFD
jgi:Iron-containing redox enzyme